jgi:four helix bundle protein
MPRRALPFSFANRVLLDAIAKADDPWTTPLYGTLRRHVNAVLRLAWFIDTATDAKATLSGLASLVSQLTRSATSVTANLCEGEGRTRTNGHYRQFLLIARGSFVEVVDHLATFEAWFALDAPARKVFGALHDDVTLHPTTLKADTVTLLKEFDTFLATTLTAPVPLAPQHPASTPTPLPQADTPRVVPPSLADPTPRTPSRTPTQTPLPPPP